MRPAADRIAGLPLAVLHDHLDGGVRPRTLLELAEETGHQLPATNPGELVAWFRASPAGDLANYLRRFDHIMPMLQAADALHRVAREAVHDLASDGVVYAELRFAPEECGVRGLSLDEVIEAVQDGIASGVAGARTPQGLRITVATIVCGLRNGPRISEVVEAALRGRRRDPRLVGFDLAGPERGFPAGQHAVALAEAAAGLRLTVHAGEETGPDDVVDAISHGARRIGHGVAVAQDIAPSGALGSRARLVRDRGICLELAPTSNVDTGVVTALSDHPVGRLLRAGFTVTVNTDNRLVSGVSVRGELAEVADAHGLPTTDLHAVTRTAVLAGFGDFDRRTEIVEKIIDPAWTARIAAEQE